MHSVRKTNDGSIDLPRAFCLMGFTAAQGNEALASEDPKEALDKALYRQMQQLAEKRKDVSKVS